LIKSINYHYSWHYFFPASRRLRLFMEPSFLRLLDFECLVL